MSIQKILLLFLLVFLPLFQVTAGSRARPWGGGKPAVNNGNGNLNPPIPADGANPGVQNPPVNPPNPPPLPPPPPVPPPAPPAAQGESPLIPPGLVSGLLLFYLWARFQRFK